jgi:oligopeptide/dipeptide ABC transporter ATP-binding protein
MMNNSDDKLLIEVKDLQVQFFLYEGVVRALEGISFKIRPGQTLGVIGESGSGKSVTAQSILGIVPSPPAKIIGGEILLHLEDSRGNYRVVDLTKLPRTGEEYRSIRGKEIGMIFQEPMTSFSPLHTIGDQIMEAILLHIPNITKLEARERAIELLRLVGIAKPARNVDNYPHQFSGGMRQRAMIAMALSCNPRLLIADEPTTALDVTIEAQILELIKDLQKEFGMAIMYISHDLAVVGGIADEVMVMYMGMVMEHASAERIFDEPYHPYTKALWRSIPKIDGPIEDLIPIVGTVPSPFAQHAGCPFYSRCAERITDVCNQAPPPQVEVKPGHLVRCYLYQDSPVNIVLTQPAAMANG